MNYFFLFSLLFFLHRSVSAIDTTTIMGFFKKAQTTMSETYTTVSTTISEDFNGALEDIYEISADISENVTSFTFPIADSLSDSFVGAYEDIPVVVEEMNDYWVQTKQYIDHHTQPIQNGYSRLQQKLQAFITGAQIKVTSL